MNIKVGLLIIGILILNLVSISSPAKKDSQPVTAWTEQQRADYYKNQEYNKYAGYSMDGVTSASKLAAQRSHTVAGEDERNFAIFTGIVVVLIVVGFTQIVFNKK